MQINLNPSEENPSTLRAVARMLNCLAADRDGSGRPATVGVVTLHGAAPVGETPNAILPNPGNAPVAPGASDQLSDGQNTGAPAAPNTKLDWSDLDANGFPWNELIHSSSKNKNADNTWRYLRGGDAAERARIEALMEAEGQALAEGRSTNTPPPPPPVAQAEQTPPPPPPVAGNDTPPPPPPVAAAQAADANGDEVTPAMVFKRANGLSKEQRDQALELVGLTAMGDFLKKQKEDPSLVQALWDAMIAITGEE